MRSLLKVVAGGILGIGGFLSVLGFIALVSDPREAQGADAQILVSLIGVVLFAGILWMLTDISEALHSTIDTVKQDETAADNTLLGRHSNDRNSFGDPAATAYALAAS